MFSLFLSIIETPVEVSENEKCGFHTFFELSQTFTRVSITRTCYLYFNCKANNSLTFSLSSFLVLHLLLVHNKARALCQPVKIIKFDGLQQLEQARETIRLLSDEHNKMFEAV